ncbi:metallophosphoesterase, partial [Candidatus Woesearchaeota archaeon]|nr:metallophosphoesterase [Candidatus Woesearchaeota archaeon]
MKLLLFVDVHSNKNHLDSVIKKSKNADILVCLGDLTMFQNNM